MILQKTDHQYMNKEEHAQQILYMLAGAIDTCIDSGFWAIQQLSTCCMHVCIHALSTINVDSRH